MANLILIGPHRVGKSSAAAWIGHLTGRSRVSLDDTQHPLHCSKIQGYQSSVIRSGPFMDKYRSWKPFELESAELIIRSVDNHVIDFGAGHSLYENEDQLGRIARAMSGHHVALLLPTANLERSRTILLETNPADDPEFINLLINNQSNQRLANATIYREGKTAKEVANEVLAAFPNWTSKAV